MTELFESQDMRFVIYSNEDRLDQLPLVSVYREGAEAEFFLSHDETPRVLLRRALGFSSDELSKITAQIETVAVDARKDWLNAFC